MAAENGNQYWKTRTRHGREKLFASGEVLWDACCEYFQWVEDNPLYEAETVKFQGDAIIVKVPKMRAMTIAGLCIFLGIDRQTWANWKKDDTLSVTVQKVEDVIYTQKFSGAAANLLNANIIARDLGLADKTQNDNVSVEMTHEQWLDSLK